jgi:hypothetical protein
VTGRLDEIDEWLLTPHPAKASVLNAVAQTPKRSCRTLMSPGKY